jgi:hypothetical protein
MATVLEKCNTEEQSSPVRFSVGKKKLNAKNIYREMFPVYGGKCLSLKAVDNQLANISLVTKKLKRKCRKWLRQQPEDFHAAGFDALVKRWDMCIDVGGGDMSRNKYFLRFKYHIFRVLYPFVTYLLTLPRTSFSSIFLDNISNCRA